ncbi:MULTISPECIES: hypothetical protein [unclassified Streptomyces]|uniref:hypothetical protein n=1 Tax=unclassified Streptomyces TaxID=2593676 RepID=UPI001BEC403E|nr:MULTISPECIES: hypothetical protein [unclassified Streptomyces]MBT2403721.1 hypothetical protein [Streptomyces sp. ISL-21]MBT2611222.1 hypothetical protein [Streptomyces sp. ISL-87]
MRIGRSLVLLAATALLAGACAGRSAEPGSRGGAEPGSRGGADPAAGASAGAAGSGRFGSAELQGRWWTWAASSPRRSNPVVDRLQAG